MNHENAYVLRGFTSTKMGYLCHIDPIETGYTSAPQPQHLKTKELFKSLFYHVLDIKCLIQMLKLKLKCRDTCRSVTCFNHIRVVQSYHSVQMTISHTHSPLFDSLFSPDKTRISSSGVILASSSVCRRFNCSSIFDPSIYLAVCRFEQPFVTRESGPGLLSLLITSDRSAGLEVDHVQLAYTVYDIRGGSYFKTKKYSQKSILYRLYIILRPKCSFHTFQINSNLFYYELCFRRILIC